MSLRNTIALLLVVVFTAGLAACGGGSSSSAGAGGGNRSAANLVVKVNGGGVAGVFEQEIDTRKLLSAISSFVIDEARAQLGGQTVFVLDSTTGEVIASDTTDASGEVAFVVPPNALGEFYTVCLEDMLASSTCVVLTESVGEQQVVTATIDDSSGQVAVVSTQVEAASDNVAEFQDPDQEHKTILCHNIANNPHTISVGTPAVDAHLGHGDTLGECSAETDPVETTSTEEVGGNGNNGNRGNNGNNQEG